MKQLAQACFIATMLTMVAGKESHAQSIPSWTASWGSSQLQPYEGEEVPKSVLNHATLRQVVHLSVGGNSIRLRFANTFGSQPLLLRSVHVALRKDMPSEGSQPSDAIVTASDRTVTFNGSTVILIPMTSEYLSDPINLPVDAFSDLVVTTFIESSPDTLTYHSGSLSTSFLLQGDHVADASFTPSQTFSHWYFLSGVEVSGDRSVRGAVVALGDSITDGYGSTPDHNGRWTDILAQRLSSHRPSLGLSVINEGIGGNRILEWGLGPTALARFDRDVLSQPGIRYLIFFEGVNDLGGLDRTEEHAQSVHDEFVTSIETAIIELATRARERGVKVLGGTITPYGGSSYYHPGLRSEADRVKLNQWIRSSGTFDAVIDFDAAVRDPAQPDHLLPAYDSGDHIHPGPAGYRRMGEAIPIEQFSK